MAALLVTIGVMSLMLSAAMPVWRQMVKREKEAELVFRGEQYARAIGLFQRKFAGAFPPNLDVLVEQKFLRRKYRDPMTEDGEFQILYQLQQSGPGGAPSGTASLPGQPATEQPPSALQTGPQTGPQTAAGGTSLAGPRGGIIGVTSKSEEPSLLLYNGRSQYNEWQFVYVDLAAQAGGGGNPGQMPGGPGAPQGGGMGPGQFPGAGGPGGFPPGGGGLGRGGSGFGGSFPGGMRPPR